MIEIDRFKSSPPSYIVEYSHLFGVDMNEFAQRHGANLLKLTRAIDYVDGMPHTTWKLFSRVPRGNGQPLWMGPIVSVTHVDGCEMVYLEDFVDPRIPTSLTINPQAVLVDILFERSFNHPELHFGGDLDSEDF
jgi:hypothetical protein